MAGAACLALAVIGAGASVIAHAQHASSSSSISQALVASLREREGMPNLLDGSSCAEPPPTARHAREQCETLAGLAQAARADDEAGPSDLLGGIAREGDADAHDAAQWRQAGLQHLQETLEDGREALYGPRGAGFANVSLSCALHLDRRILPEFALSATYRGFLQARAGEEVRLQRHLRSYLKSDLQPKQRPLHACMYYRSAPRYTAFLDAFREMFTRMKIGTTMQIVHPDQAEMDRCDLFIHKGMRMKDVWPTRRRHRFPHVIFWEFPLLWREDPVDPERVWAFISWDYLQGYGMPLGNMPADRWQRYFAEHIRIHPWIGPKPQGYALILGQIPSDTTVVASVTKYNADIFEIYRKIVRKIKAVMPSLAVVYRPHPDLGLSRNYCKGLDGAVAGATVRTHQEQSLDDALAGAAVVVGLSSGATIQAVFRGIPTITLDYIAPTYPVSCHSLDSLPAIVVSGTACRPPRQQWLHDLAYTMWNRQDVANGDLFRFLFRRGPQLFDNGTGFSWTKNYYKARSPGGQDGVQGGGERGVA